MMLWKKMTSVFFYFACDDVKAQMLNFALKQFYTDAFYFFILHSAKVNLSIDSFFELASIIFSGFLVLLSTIRDDKKGVYVAQY